MPKSWKLGRRCPSATYGWGDGNSESGTVFQGAGSGTVSGTHVYAANETYTVQVCVTDNDGGEGCDQLFVVANVTNQVSASPVEDVGHTFNEGESHIHGFTYQDINPDDHHTATVDWGDGTAIESVAIVNDLKGVGVGFPSHTYADNGDYTVTITICDGNDCESRTIVEHVDNLPPLVEAGSDQAVEQTANLGATFTDPGILDTHTATIDWGDDTATEPGGVVQGAGSGDVSGSHTYAQNGVFVLTVCVTDNDGGVGCDTLVVTVNSFLLNGRMTGGGSFFAQGVRYTHGFELHCDMARDSNNLEIKWGKGNRFKLTSLTSARCTGTDLEGKPIAGFDTYEGEGLGSLNGGPEIAITFRFTDRGEPGKDVDEAEFSIIEGLGVARTTLDKGNHQAHPKK